MVIKSETLPNNLNERRFRGYWEKTDKSEMNEGQYVARRLKFGRFLAFLENSPNGENSKTLPNNLNAVSRRRP
jgi:hypothetical protein